MTQVPTRSHLQTYVSMEIIKGLQRHLQYSKKSLYSAHPQDQIKFSFEDDKVT